MVVFGQSGCNWPKVVCISGKMDVFGQKLLYFGKVVLFGLGGCIWGKIGCIGDVWLY